ncbi:MAG: DnaB-like helicase N-terminal domain-containing protein, partial [Acinetobacter sp.]
MNAEHNIFDMGIEQAVLSTLLYGDAMDEHIQNLTEAHFFPARHKMLFRYIKEIFKSGETYDVIMVNER